MPDDINKTEIKIVNVRRLKPHTDANTIAKIAHELGIEPDKVMTEFVDIKSNEEDAASDDEAEFEVEAILNRRRRNNKLEYFVKWKGYPTSDNTWEPIEHLANCADLVTTFDYNYSSKSRMSREEKKEINSISRKK
jgi:hypothetical protein